MFYIINIIKNYYYNINIFLVDTGKTMVELLKFLKNYNPRSIKVACLMIKKRENQDYPYIVNFILYIFLFYL